MILPGYENWKSWSVEKIAQTFAGLEWILAGGFALELFVGKNYRNHTDIDILLKREDQKELLKYIEKSKIFVAENGKLLSFEEKLFYKFPVQDIWILNEDFSAWCLQIMLYDVEDGFWIYKRNKNIKVEYDCLFWEKDGIKLIKPEIQLLYKSKSIRPKDEEDFQIVSKKLDENAKKWLNNTLTQCYGQHKWISN
jgi:hypothetical protein